MGSNKKEKISCNTGPLKASSKLHEMMKKKITTAVEFASKASIYRADITATELNTAQSILLSLMHSLLTNDLGFCVSLLELATTVDHLRSSYLPTWLRDDFNFDDQQVLRVLSRAALLVQSGLIIIPTHILKVFVSLSPKYRVVECCRASGNTDMLKFLLEFNLQEFPSNYQSTTMASSFSSNSTEMNRNSSINILPTINSYRTMGEPFYVNVPQILANRSVQNPFGEGMAKQGTLAERAAKQAKETVKRGRVQNTNAQTELHFLDDHSFLDNEESFVERIENPSPTLQEVWIESSATPPAQSSSIANRSSLNELHMCTVREYLKVPEDFNEEDLLSLMTYSDTEGRTPLHRAVKDGNPHVVECMLMLGAEVNEKDTFGSTPSHSAALIGSVPILQVLAQNQADFSLTRNDGCTPLHVAITNGHEAACRWLLDHGSEINVCNIDGCSPLHLAAQWNKLAIAKILLDNGADPNIYNNNGMTPVDIAREKAHSTLEALLSV